MKYLKNLVEGSAATTIAGLKLSDENYDVALNLLKERFDNKQLLISSHMKALLQLEPAHDIKDVVLLRNVYDHVEKQVRSLQNLGITSDMYGPLLIPEE